MSPQLFTYHTIITGHEHLYDFGLINMNGRMYDPVYSSFLSPDNYMQDPTSQQGFNRYAYCMYNPLKYVDPSGESYFGWNGNSSYYDEQASRLVMSIRFNNYLESMQMTRKRIDNFSNSLWSQGDSYGGAIGENGCHGGGSGNLGSPGGGGDGKTTSTKNYNEKQLKKALNNAKRGICVFGALGSMNTCWGDDIIGETAKDWIRKENDYYNQTGKHGYETGNILEFIPWNPDGKYNNYEVA